MTEVLVVRHGQSTWNVEHRFTGQADPPLSPLGERQALALAVSVRGRAVDAVVTSDLRRAHRTGSVVAGVIGLPAPHVVPDLRERWSEGLTGRTQDEIEAEYPGTLAAWRRGRPVAAPGPHEEFAVFTDRVLRGLVAAAGHGNCVMVAAHAGTFVALDAAFGVPGSEVANAEGRSVRAEGGHVVHVFGRLVLPPSDDLARTGEDDP